MPRYVLEGLEAEARLLYEKGSAKIDNEWSSAELAALNCLKANPYGANSREGWGKLCSALESWLPNEARWKKAWGRLVRAGLARSYNEGGERWYEWNFS